MSHKPARLLRSLRQKRGGGCIRQAVTVRCPWDFRKLADDVAWAPLGRCRCKADRPTRKSWWSRLDRREPKWHVDL